MDIKDTNKISNLDKLDTKGNFKILELEGINLDDDWSKLSKLKNLETLILKDSYIDFKKFYNSIFSLKKLNKLILNHYCYFNKTKKDKFEKKGMSFSGLSPDGFLPEIIELKNHPWFIGVQFHPEFKSRPFAPHPLFSSFIKASKNHK